MEGIDGPPVQELPGQEVAGWSGFCIGGVEVDPEELILLKRDQMGSRASLDSIPRWILGVSGQREQESSSQE